jgi:hypothetical protein
MHKEYISSNSVEGRTKIAKRASLNIFLQTSKNVRSSNNNIKDTTRFLSNLYQVTSRSKDQKSKKSFRARKKKDKQDNTNLLRSSIHEAGET